MPIVASSDNPRRFVVRLKESQPGLLENDGAYAFDEGLRRAEDSRLEHNPPLGICTAFAPERNKWDILCLPKPENRIRTAHSLGDGRTTVFISEFGELVSFSKNLYSGMLDTVLVEPPILSDIDKEDEFNDILDGRLPGLGLRLKDREQIREQNNDYIHDRWPRVSYKVGDLDVKVQFIVDQGIVAQQYLIKNSSQAPSTCEFVLDLGFGCRPSTFGSSWDSDPQPLAQSWITLTAGDHAAMLWAGDTRGQVQLDVVLFQDGRSVKLDLSKQRLGSSQTVRDRVLDQPGNGNEWNAETVSPYHLHTVTIGPGVTQELTALYSLKRYSPNREPQQVLQPGSENEEVDKSEKHQVLLNDGANESQSITAASVEKSTNAIPSTWLNLTGSKRAKENESTQEDSFWNYEGENDPDDLVETISEEEVSKLEVKIRNEYLLSSGLEYIDASNFLKSNYRGNWTLESKSTSTVRLLRRNLQQVLFVNSLTVPCQGGLRSAIYLSHTHFLRHLVSPWSSLCMFRFLLSMYAFLDGSEVVDEKLRDYLKLQIKNTCEGHLDWIFDVARPYQRGWADFYNPNGLYYKIDQSHARRWYHGAVNFIKLYEFQMLFQTLNDRTFVLQKLQKRLGPWFESLEMHRDPKSDMWISYFVDVNVDWLDPQYRQDESFELPVYVISQHILLWKALSFVFQLLDDANLKVLPLAKSGTSESTTSEVYNWRKTFSPSKLRTKIMDHFTYEQTQNPKESDAQVKDAAAPEEGLDNDKNVIENAIEEAGAPTKAAATLEEVRGDEDTIKSYTEIVKDHSTKSLKHRQAIDRVRRKRVLAFRWAGNDKPRYLWYSWASPIFEGVNSGFFKGESSSRVWKDTLEAQRVHHEPSWVKVARYALALRAAQYGQSLDVTMDADRMRSEVKDRLLKCFYSNGTFPTQLDLTSKQPTNSWPTADSSPEVFEIPLLLLQEEFKCLDVAAFLVKTADNRPGDPILPNIPTLRRDLTVLKVSADRNTKDVEGTKDDLDFDKEMVAKERAKMAKVAKHSVRSTKIDRANIRDPPDFEPDWLFPYPDCFAPKEDTRTYEEICKQIREEADDLRQDIEYDEEPAYMVFGSGIDKFCSTEPGKESTFLESIPTGRLTIIDVGQANFRKQIRADSPSLINDLLSKRTWKTAKKRLTIIESCQSGQALLLYLGSPQSERLSTAGFLTRHKMREDFIRDHAHKEVNMWITELHLSFYKKTIVTSNLPSSMPDLAESIFEGPEKLFAFPGKSKSSLDKLQKGAIGWRFSGDLHDRGWTGIILAFVPGIGDASWVRLSDLRSDKGFHGQRKIIEAQLFSKMTKTIHVSTREVLRDLNAVLGEGEGGIYRGSSEHHDPLSETFDQSYSRSKLYLELSDFLSHLDDSFKNTMETIEAYVDREKQRPVQPRWSIEDERQYRTELQKWDREGKKNVALLSSVRNEISTKMSRVNRLRESLNADMQLRETRLQARSAEDVRLFTYVTIIFLPISFSSSLFSMSKAPDDGLVGTFAKVAVIALVITFAILFNLKTMSRNMWTYVNAGLHKISDTMSTSSWNFWKTTHMELLQAEKRNIQSDEPLEIRKMSRWWYCLFLFAFVLWELPAIRVLLACDVLFPPTEKDSKQPTLLKKIIRVILGLVFLPLFVFTFTIVFLLQNCLDLFRLFASPELGKQKLVQGSKTSSDRSKVLREPRINDIDTENKNKGASKAQEDEPVRAYQEKYNARVRRLTHPPSLYRSSPTARDRRSKGAKNKEKDQDSKIEGEKGHSPSTKMQITRVLSRLGLKTLPSEVSQWAQKKADLESNDERSLRAGQGVAVG